LLLPPERPLLFSDLSEMLAVVVVWK